jgi:uncharacterized protein YggE
MMNLFSSVRFGWLRFLGLGVGVLALTMSPALACQHDGPPPRLVTTQGHGEVKARPDSLTVSATVDTRQPTLAAARAENNRKAQSVIAALKALNIPGLKLETRYISVYPIQDEPQRGRLPRVIGYQANNSVEATVTGAPVDKLGEYGSRILDTALNAGANQTGGIRFFIADMAAARTQALELAVKDAQRNADAMARAANITLSGVYSLEGTPQFGGYPMPMMAMKARGAADEAAASVPVETGETTVTSDVTARFKF